MDRSGWHIAKNLAIPVHLTPLFLPPYSPGLNAIERVWLCLRERCL
jgi:transposase